MSSRRQSNLINVITINTGGSQHNPFEYYQDENIIKIPDEWNYRETLKNLTSEILKEHMKCFKGKYVKLKEYLDKFENITFVDYFFPKTNVSISDKILTLDNKFGRKDSEIKRFNPIEFGYDKVPGENTTKNQYIYTRDYSKNNYYVGNILEKCLEVPLLNKNFSLEHTNWLEGDYEIERVYDILIYDMMKTYAVYINYKIFDKLYISNKEDKRLDTILEIIQLTPTIIVTQEGGFNKEDKRLKALFIKILLKVVYVYIHVILHQIIELIK